MTLEESTESSADGNASSKPPSSAPRRPARWMRQDRRNLLVGLFFISPWLIGFVALYLYPALASLYYSFTDFRILQSPQWVGLANYAQLVGPAVLEVALQHAGT